MSSVFERWTERIDAAEDEAARRALLVEIGGYRARNLTDIPALRESAFAMSRLFLLLGDGEGAVREARTLLSLCQTTPQASREELQAARGWLESLGERVKVAPRLSRPPEATDPVQRARDAARRGKYNDAIRSLKGRKGARTDLLRTWISLARALDDEGPQRDQRLRELEGRLRKLVGVGAPTEPPKVAKKAPAPAKQSALAALLGVDRLPRKRNARIEQLEQFAAANPDKHDALASTALEDHVASAGVKSPAPWLVGLVAQALAFGSGEATRKAIQTLSDQGAYAVTAYEEWPFSRAVELLAEAARQKWTFHGLRRGVLPRGEPGNRKLWTLRLHRDGETMLVIGAPTGEPYRGATPVNLAQRIAELCPRSLVLAPGDGNAELREACAGLGIGVLADDDANGAILEALAKVEAITPPAEVPQADPLEALGAALATDTTPEIDALVPLVQQLRRSYEAFSFVRSWPAEPNPHRDQSMAVLLRAVDQGTPAKVRLAEGTALAIELAARLGPDSATWAVLHDSERYGGPGIDAAVTLAGIALDKGWRIHRVLRGVTARERRSQKALDAVADKMQGLWRLVLDRDDTRIELWFVSDLPPEGRAGVPQLLVEDRTRVFAVPDQGVADWLSQQGPAPLLIDDTDAVGAALS